MNPVVGTVSVLAFAVLVGGALFFEAVLVFVTVPVVIAVFFCASVGATSESRQTARERGRVLIILLFTVSDSLMKI